MITHREPAKTVYSPHPLLGALLDHRFGDWRITSLDPAGWTSTRGAVFDIKCVFCGRHSQASASGLLEGPLCGCKAGIKAKGRQQAASDLRLRKSLLKRADNWRKSPGGMTWANGTEAVNWILSNFNLPPFDDMDGWSFMRPDSSLPWGPDNIDFRPKFEVRQKVGETPWRVKGEERRRLKEQERKQEADGE